MMSPSLTQEALDDYKTPINEEELINSWLISSPVLIVGVSMTYLVFVFFWGPWMMKDKKAYDLKFPMMVFNLVQVVYNLYMSLLFVTYGALPILFGHHTLGLTLNEQARMRMFEGIWHYEILKFLDLIDTVFMVLRKKPQQITFLHVYHHFTMVIFPWITLKYYREEQSIMQGYINTIVHVIMYTYYFLTCFGESMRPYLWWKRYITEIQIAQFITALTYLSILVLVNNKMCIIYTSLCALHNFICLVLFLQFYFASYSKKNSASAVKSKTH